MAPTIRSRHQARLEGLRQERSQYEPLWREYDKLIAPGRLRLPGMKHKGVKQMEAILDEAGLEAFRTFKSGMHSGLTSPARPWIKLNTIDKDLREFGPVKDYLFQCQRTTLQVMRGTNIYNALHSSYGDLGQFCHSCMLIVGEGKDIRAVEMRPGQYWFAQNGQGRIDTLYRQINMTVEQAVEKFVHKPNRDMDWSRVSQTVKNLYDSGNYDEWIEIFHAVEPRKDRDPDNPGKRHKAWTSNYWEEGQSGDIMLGEDGFDFNRILAPRYDADAEDVYGSGHPAEHSLAAIKMLQMEQKNKGQAIDKSVRPPLQGPTALRTAGVSTLPGKISYYDDPTGRSGLRPVYEVNLNLSDLGADIEQTQARIQRLWYADLFFAISRMDGVQPRNIMELSQRKEEQLLQLGPTIERQIYEQANPLVEMVFRACEAGGLFPEPPQEMAEREEPLEIENISILAQAQRAVATGSIERMTAYVGQLASAQPEVLDKFDADQAVDEYGEAIGVPSTLLRSDDDVKSIREQRQQQIEAKEQAEMATQIMPAVKDGADAARLMSEAGQNASGNDLFKQLGLA